MSHTNESVLMCTMCSCESAVWLCLQMPINMLEYAVQVVTMTDENKVSGLVSLSD